MIDYAKRNAKLAAYLCKGSYLPSVAGEYNLCVVCAERVSTEGGGGVFVIMRHPSQASGRFKR